MSTSAPSNPFSSASVLGVPAQGLRSAFPQSVKEATDDTDAYIADALHHMTIQERDFLYHELHGVADVVEESPEFLMESFKELHRELKRLSAQPSSSLDVRPYLAAVKPDRAYTHSEFHFKAFLRAERFDVKAAAMRMIRFFDYKEQSFGPDSLCKDVTQDMLSAEDLQVYRKGFMQVLPCRDIMGRCICIMFPRLTSGFGTPERMVREIFLDAILNDDSCENVD